MWAIARTNRVSHGQLVNPFADTVMALGLD